MVPAFFWAMIIIAGALIIRSSRSNLPEYKYYIPNILAKMFFGISFGLVYIFVYGGGDTTAYYDSAIAMNNLFFKSPQFYFEQLITSPEKFNYTKYYDGTTGFPPHWIYRESEGFFVAKIISIFSFFTLKSYFAMTIIISTFTAHASWKLFQLVRTYNFSHEKYLAVGILFLPSVNFWCSSISKDSIIFICAMYLITCVFKIISNNHKTKIKHFIIIIICAFLIIHIRMFILGAIAIPLFFAITARIIRLFGGGNMAVIAGRTLILIFGVVLLSRSFAVESENDLLASNTAVQEAALIQKDFQNNKTYGDKKYDLGEVEFSAIGLLKVMPIAILTGIFRPFIWEALSPTLIMNGLESMVFIYFAYYFFRRNLSQKWSFIRGHEFLIFCLIFILIISFMTGMTSILYGVLVRLRSPLLPFLFILLNLDVSNFKNTPES